MVVVLDPPRFRHGLAIAALARVELWPTAGPQGAAAVGSKQPLGVLLHDGTLLRGFDIAGRPLSEAEVERLLPGAGRNLAAAWRNRKASPAA